MNRWYKIYFLFVTGCLAFLGIFTVCMPREKFSQNENRVLAQFPHFSWKSFVRGEYQEKLETASNDQFPGRNTLTATASMGQRVVGLKDVGETYIGKDGYYLSQKTDSDIDMFRYMENLRYVEYLSQHHNGSTTLLLVPSAGTVLSEKLPTYAPYYHADAMYEAASAVCGKTTLVDIRKDLEKQKKHSQVYFRTDHHWTLRGAHVGYEALCRKMNLKVQDYEYFSPKAVSKSFLGTLHSRVLDGSAKPDTLYAPQNLSQVSKVECDGKERKSIYDEKKLKEKDQYGYFFGGNYGKVTIATGGSSGRKLLMFKDSFANSLVPFLLEQYDEITMIDLRYYRNSASTILQEENDADLLVLYEMSNFAEDSNLWKLTK